MRFSFPAADSLVYQTYQNSNRRLLRTGEGAQPDGGQLPIRKWFVFAGTAEGVLHGWWGYLGSSDNDVDDVLRPVRSDRAGCSRIDVKTCPWRFSQRRGLRHSCLGGGVAGRSCQEQAAVCGGASLSGPVDAFHLTADCSRRGGHELISANSCYYQHTPLLLLLPPTPATTRILFPMSQPP